MAKSSAAAELLKPPSLDGRCLLRFTILVVAGAAGACVGGACARTEDAAVAVVPLVADATEGAGSAARWV